MHIIKNFNRFELKYILTLEEAAKLTKELSKYVEPDPFSNENGKYLLTSLYYDSPDYRYYWEKVDGIKYRRKLRIRWYETEERLTDDSTVFVEIKQRVDRVTQKRRVPMTYREALRFCNEGIMPKHDAEDRKALEEMYSLIKLHRLRPTAITSYERQAFVGTDYDMGLRITFDRHVTYRLRDLDMNAGTYDGFIVPPNYVIMEIKTNDRVPYWITELVAANNMRLIRVSKYCQSLDQAQAQ